MFVVFSFLFNFQVFFCRCCCHHCAQTLHHPSLSAWACLWSVHIKSSSLLFFTPHPSPYFVVYCCGPVRLRSKHSWSLSLAWPILFFCLVLVLLVSAGPSSDVHHHLISFFTVSSVFLYLLLECDCYQNFKVFNAIQGHMLPNAITGL